MKSVFAGDDAIGAEPRLPGRPRILVVEDDFLVGVEMESELQRAGFDVTGIAASADEAIALATAEQPSLAIVDIRLNGRRDGIDAAIVMLREHGVRCIFATAHADDHVRARAAAASPLGWLQKPYTMPSLVALVRQALAQLERDG
jgi:DNA-binding response OmpR family regulator